MSIDWERVTELFDRARQLAHDSRASFLDRECRGDTELRREVDALLSADRDDDFLNPVAGRAADASRPDSLQVGYILNQRYRIEESLASGGQALVFRATDLVLSRIVAIKVAHARPYNPLLKQRFETEMQALSRIDHPSVVGILDVGELGDGSPFLVIQHVNGTTLRERLRGGPLVWSEAAGIVRQVGVALGAAHAAGVAHRDLKPENIMLQARDDGSELVKLIDFGIAKIERADLPQLTTVTIEGSVRYMAPEQFEGFNSPASDVYALALVACELMSGRPDIRALPRTVPRKVRILLERALAFDPLDRPANVHHWSEELADAMRGRLMARPLIATAATVALVAWLVSVLVPTGSSGANRIIEKIGGFDPLTEGFTTHNPLVGGIVQNADRTGFEAWSVASEYPGGGFYVHALTSEQQKRALERGWRLASAFRATEGAAGVALLFADRRFDINLFAEDGHDVVRLNTQLVPDWQGLEVRLLRGDTGYRTYELRYDPGLRTADLWIDGERRLTGYRGHDQFVDRQGLLFGAAPFKGPRGVGAFRSVRFEINP